jgi:hypothetical protein
MESPILGLRGAGDPPGGGAVPADPDSVAMGAGVLSSLRFDPVSDMGRSSHDARTGARDDGERGGVRPEWLPSFVSGVCTRGTSGPACLRNGSGPSGASFQVLAPRSEVEPQHEEDTEADQAVPGTC